MEHSSASWWKLISCGCAGADDLTLAKVGPEAQVESRRRAAQPQEEPRAGGSPLGGTWRCPGVNLVTSFGGSNEALPGWGSLVVASKGISGFHGEPTIKWLWKLPH